MPGSLISGVQLSSTSVLPGESLLVEVQTTDSQTQVTIDGRRGSRQYLQFSGTPSERKVHILALSVNGDVESRFVEVELRKLREGETGFPTLLIVPSDPAEPLSATFGLHWPTREYGARFGDSQFDSQFEWEFGDGAKAVVVRPSVSHSFRESLDPNLPYSLFDVTLRAKSPGIDDSIEFEVRRTLTVWNASFFSRQRGTVIPRVKTNHLATLDKGRVVGLYSITNYESESITFDTLQVEFLSTDPDGLVTPEAPQPFTLSLAGGTSVDQKAEISFATIPEGADGFAVHLHGKTDVGGLAATASAYFEFARDAVGAIRRTSLATGIRPRAGLASPNGGLENTRCDPENLPDPVPEGWVCQATGEPPEEVMIPGRLLNARKGDVLLSPGVNGLIGGLLKTVTPAQAYSHSAIMTKNYYEVRHSTASEDWLFDVGAGGGGAPTDGLDPQALKFLWPGTITQTADGAVLGQEFVAPNGNGYWIRVITYHPENDRQNDRWELIDPLVVKPHPSRDDRRVRGVLHRVANEAAELQGHYRLFCYTDAALGLRDDGIAPNTAGWAAGTRATVCSSFVWLAAKRAGVQLEGLGEFVSSGDLENTDIGSGALVDNETHDGVYLYTESERRAAADWLEAYLESEVDKQAGDFGEFFTDIADDISNQIANTFAFDWSDTDAKDSDRWHAPGVGRVVSPSDILTFWDAPEETEVGYYGHSEIVLYRPARKETRPVSRWKRAKPKGKITGEVSFDGRSVSDVIVSLGGIEANVDSGGRYNFDAPSGDYVLSASKAFNGQLASVSKAVTVVPNVTSTIDLQLELPNDKYRQIEIRGPFHVEDDETFSSNEWVEGNLFEIVYLDPSNPLASITKPIKVGGEVRLDIRLDLSLLPDYTVNLHWDMDFWEGTDEDTTDPNDHVDQDHGAILAPKSESDERNRNVLVPTIRLNSPGGDYATITMMITNRRQP